MKILHVGQMIGGLDVYIRNTTVYNKADNDYVIVCGKEDKHEPVIRDGKTVKEHHIDLYRSLNPKNDLKALRQTVKIIREEKPDLIHCHSAKGGAIGRIAGWLTGVPTCYTPHAFSYLCTPSKIKSSIYKAIERLTKFHTYVLACGESEQSMAVREIGYQPSHSLVWHNAVPDASLEHGKTVEFNEPYACYIGRPSYQKNILFLLDALKAVKDKRCPLKFILLGVGYHSPELEAVKEKIHALGLEDTIKLEPWISHADCQEYVRKSLFYVSTALYEGLPLAVIEAMANGKAIITSDVVGNRDCVKNNENGFLLPMNKDAFAEKMVLLYENQDKREEMGRKSRELFIEEFYINNRISQLQKNYELVATTRTGGVINKSVFISIAATIYERRAA